MFVLLLLQLALVFNMNELSISLVLNYSLSSLSNVKDFVLCFRDNYGRCRQKVFSSPLAVLNYIKRYHGDIVGFYRDDDGSNYYDFKIFLREKYFKLIIGVCHNA